MFQHTAARRRLGAHNVTRSGETSVSTHSRPKAAGFLMLKYQRLIIGFNTQPPEGGWPNSFQVANSVIDVSTHSRPKAAGTVCTLHFSL